MKKYKFIVQMLVVAAMSCSILHLSAQDKTGQIQITGTVVDAYSNRPLMGASVRVAETNVSVITDTEGAFELPVPHSSVVLVVSMPDYALREVALQGKSTVNIPLYSEKFASGYEVINALTGNKRQSLLTSSVVAASGFANSTAMTIEDDIQSRLGADVRAVTRTGVQGVGAALFIRGFNSLNANAQPLFIVDGVIWDNQLNGSSVNEGYFSNPLTNIAVRDIESVTVLKDGLALYGSKAANGVILIKTLRGKDQVTRITANMLFGATQKPTLPKMMNASQYKLFASNQIESFLNWYGGSSVTEENLVKAFPFLEEDPSNTFYRTYHNDTDWSEDIYHTGNTQSYSVAVNGGDEIALYNMSMGYATGSGTIKNTGLERLNARFNSDIQLHEKIFARIDIAISRTVRDLRDDGVDPITSPGFVALVKSPLLAWHGYNKVTGAATTNYENADYIDPRRPLSNPKVLTDAALGNSRRTVFNMILNPYVNLTKNITLGTVFGFTMNRVKESFFVPKAGLAPQTVNLFGRADNIVRDYAQRQTSVYNDTQLEWKLTFNENHHLDLLGGFRYLTNVYESDLPYGYNTGNDNTKVLTDGLQYKLVSGVNNVWKSMSWYANATYDYQRKYWLTVTASADASSRFGKQAKSGIGFAGQSWGVFPGVNAGWVVSSEDFMKEVSWVDFLKVRAGYDVTGNDDIDAYTGRSYFAPTTYLGGAIGLTLANIKNESIQWETSKKASAGIDLHLFNERLSVSADVFSSKTDNLLTLKKLKDIAGLDSYWSNDGSLKNQGYEVAFNTKLLNLRALKWELGASIGHYKNEITSLPDGKDFTTDVLGGQILTAVGQPAGVFYGYKTNGVYATAAEANDAFVWKQLPNGSYLACQAGDVRFVNSYTQDDGYLFDASGNLIGDRKGALINGNDRQIIGDPNPDFYGSISTKFTHKRWSLDVLATYSYGNDVYNYLRSQLESGANFYNQTTAMMNRWQKEGDVTLIPRASYGDIIGNNDFSDRWIEDGSYLRLKAVTLSYEVPFNLTYLQGITVWATANNLYTWTKYLGSDPETSINNTVLHQGIDAGLLPQSRSFYLGVRINL